MQRNTILRAVHVPIEASGGVRLLVHKQEDFISTHPLFKLEPKPEEVVVNFFIQNLVYKTIRFIIANIFGTNIFGTNIFGTYTYESV